MRDTIFYLCKMYMGHQQSWYLQHFLICHIGNRNFMMYLSHKPLHLCTQVSWESNTCGAHWFTNLHKGLQVWRNKLSTCIYLFIYLSDLDQFEIFPVLDNCITYKSQGQLQTFSPCKPVYHPDLGPQSNSWSGKHKMFLWNITSMSSQWRVADINHCMWVYTFVCFLCNLSV